MIENGIDGFILEEMEATKWAACMKEIYKDKGRMQEIQSNASLKIKNNFTWDILADRFIEQYEAKIKGE